MNRKLKENNYLIIPNFISSYKANILAEEFKIFSEKNNLIDDEQVPNSRAVYNYISFLEILCEKNSEVSEILEETVLPTYSYARVYKNKNILKSHLDRNSCEISLTLHLGGDKSWPIFIKTPENEKRSITLNPGDAMMYLGTIAEHWRDEYQGEWYAQVFLHYVRSRGNYSEFYFDNFKDNEEVIGVNQQNVNYFSKLSTEHKESLIIENNNENKSNSIKTHTDSKKQNNVFNSMGPTSTLESFIQVFDNVLSEEECSKILNEYKTCDLWRYAKVGGDAENTYIRNCMEIPISMNNIIEQNYEERKNIDHLIFHSVSKVIKNYQELFPSFNIEIDTGYQLLRYTKNQFYVQHTDSFKQQQRSLSCSIHLNDDYEGGEFAFFDRQIMAKVSRGSVIVFPSNFMYPHEIMPVTSGERYSIITWLV